MEMMNNSLGITVPGPLADPSLHQCPHWGHSCQVC